MIEQQMIGRELQQISQRAQSLMPTDFTRFFSSFFRENEQAKAEGFDLSIGNVCQIPAVEQVLQDALIHVSRNSRKLTKYPGTQGYFPLNEKLVELMKKETGVSFDPEEIVLTNGACDALYGSFYTFSSPGDYSCYCIPSFPYWSIAGKAGVKSSLIVYKNPFDYTTSYGDAVQRKIESNKRIKTVIINEPHNPIGKLLEPSQVNSLRDACVDNNVMPIFDDVYRSFTDSSWVGKDFDMNSAVIVDSFSKRFGMPGLRLGFARMPKKLVPYYRASLANQVVGINMITALVADYILEHEQENKLSRKIAREMSERQRKLDGQLKKLNSGIVSPRPDGGIYRLIELGELARKNVMPMDASALLMKNGVKTVPGDKLLVHGIDPERSPKLIRLSVGGEPNTRDAGQKIVEVLESVQKRK